MEFFPQFHDYNAYHYKECNDNISMLRYYVDGELNSDLRYYYKRVMFSIVEQHRKDIEEYASSNHLIYDKVELTWINDLKAKINSINEHSSN